MEDQICWWYFDFMSKTVIAVISTYTEHIYIVYLARNQCIFLIYTYDVTENSAQSFWTSHIPSTCNTLVINWY